MPVGSPDFNQNPASNPTSPVFNQGEVPNRVLMGGGSNSQAGWWLWASGFEDGFAEWDRVSVANVFVTSERVYQGANACKVLTNSVVNDEQFLFKRLFPQGNSYGFEFVFSNDLSTAPGREISFQIRGKNKIPGIQATGEIVIDVVGVNNANLYTDNNGTRVLIANINNYAVDQAGFFHYCKLVFDPYQNQYHRLYFDDLSFDLGLVPGYSANSNDQSLLCRIGVLTKTAAQARCYFDNVIITAGEP